jgi:hypothetical protein
LTGTEYESRDLYGGTYIVSIVEHRGGGELTVVRFGREFVVADEFS